MLFKRLFHFSAQLFLGKELGLSLLLLHIIRQALHNPSAGDVARIVYAQLPANWRNPQGPLTETEFVDMVVAGQAFLGKVQGVLKA
jgi:hypothetical protein